MSFPFGALAVTRYKAPPTSPPFSFAVGEHIQVLAQEDEEGDWYSGTNAAGHQGLFPSTAVTPTPIESSQPSIAAVPTPVVEAAFVEQPVKESAPPPPTKPSSLKDRIAALNAAGAGATAPGQQSKPSSGVIPRGKPFVFKKPIITPTAPTPSIPTPRAAQSISEDALPKEAPASIESASATTQRSSSHEGEDEGMSASDAVASISKGGSLKDRIAALQGLKLDVPGSDPKPWKKKSLDVDTSAPRNTASDTVDSTKSIAEPAETAAPSLDLSPPSPNTAVDTASPLSPAVGLGGTAMAMPAIPRRAGPPRRKTPSPSLSTSAASSPTIAAPVPVADEKSFDQTKPAFESTPTEDIISPVTAVATVNPAVMTIVESGEHASPEVDMKEETVEEPDQLELVEEPEPLSDSVVLVTPPSAITKSVSQETIDFTPTVASPAPTPAPPVRGLTRPPIPTSFTRAPEPVAPIVATVDAKNEVEDEGVEEDTVVIEPVVSTEPVPASPAHSRATDEHSLDEEDEDAYKSVVTPTLASVPTPTPTSAASTPAPTRSAPPARKLPNLVLPPRPSPSLEPASATDASPSSPATRAPISEPATTEAVEGVAEEVEQSEEEIESARRAALAKRMARLGGMRMGGIFPPASAPPRSPVKAFSEPIVAQAAVEEKEEPIVARVPGSIPTGGFRLPIAPPRAVPIPPTEIAPNSPALVETTPEVKAADEDVIESAEADDSPPLPAGRPPQILATAVHDEPEEVEEEEEEEEEQFEEEEAEEEEEQEEQVEHGQEEEAPAPPPRSYPAPTPTRTASIPPRSSLPPLPSLPIPLAPQASSQSFLSDVAIESGSFDPEVESEFAPLPLETPPVAPRITPTELNLENWSTTLGAQIFAAAHSKLSTSKMAAMTSADFIAYCFARAPDAVPPTTVADGSDSYGELIYALRFVPNAKAPHVVIMAPPSPGDVVVFRSTKFKKNLTTMKIDYAIGIVSNWDEKKKKLRVVEVQEKEGVVEISHRLDELKAGNVEVWRVVPRMRA